MREGDIVMWKCCGSVRPRRGVVVESCNDGVNEGYYLVRTEDGRHILLAPESAIKPVSEGAV